MNIDEAIKVLKNLQAHDRRSIIEVDRKAIDTVIAEVEKPKYMADDMEAFAEWCYINAEWSKKNEWMLFANDGSGFKVTTTQVRERWEVETGRKEATNWCMRCWGLTSAKLSRYTEL